MKTVEITAGFTGYPNGTAKRKFIKGEQPELANDYADLIINKKLGREVPTKTKTAEKE